MYRLEMVILERYERPQAAFKIKCGGWGINAKFSQIEHVAIIRLIGISQAEDAYSKGSHEICLLAHVRDDGFELECSLGGNRGIGFKCNYRPMKFRCADFLYLTNRLAAIFVFLNIFSTVSVNFRFQV